MKKILCIARLYAFALGFCSCCGEKVTEKTGKDIFGASTGAAVSGQAEKVKGANDIYCHGRDIYIVYGYGCDLL